MRSAFPEILRRGIIGLLIGTVDLVWAAAATPHEMPPSAAWLILGWVLLSLAVAPQRREVGDHLVSIGVLAALIAMIALLGPQGVAIRAACLLVALGVASARSWPRWIAIVATVAAIAALWVRSPLSARGGGTPSAAPNVLLVTVDTWRADSRSSSERALVPELTPFIDRLAAAGCSVEPAFSTSPLTGPSHGAMHSGVHPIELGVLLNGRPIPADVPWLAEELAAQGYQTEAFVSSAMLHHELGYARGFDRYDDDIDGLGGPRQAALGWWLGAPDRMASFERPGAATLDRFARSATPHAPLFSWVHLYDPHRPYLPSEESLAAIPKSLDLPAASAFDTHPVGPPPLRGLPGGQLLQLQAELFGTHAPPLVSERERRDATAVAAATRYLAEVSDTDRLVERAFAIFEARTGGPPDVWMVVGDHGESLSEHHEIGSHQRHLYRANTEVPLLMSPGLCPPGPVSTLGVRDALLERIGLPNVPDWDQPIVSAVVGPAHGGAPGTLRKLMMRKGSRALLVTLPPDGRTLEQYDLVTDPHERFRLPVDPNFVAGAEPWIEALRSFEQTSVDAELAEALEALGYAQ